MICKVYKGYRQSKKLAKPLDFINKDYLKNLEEKYKLNKKNWI